MSESTSTPPDSKGKKKGLLTGKNKWYVVAALAGIAILVFVFVRKSNANATGTSATGTTPAGLDPTTSAALQSALQAQAAQGFTSAGTTGTQGTAGATGPAGPAGPAGPKGATGTMTTGHAKPPGSHPSPPKPASTTFYTVKPGETLAGIASKLGISITTLAHANQYIEGPKKGQTLGTGAGLPTGQRLTIPHVAAAK